MGADIAEVGDVPLERVGLVRHHAVGGEPAQHLARAIGHDLRRLREQGALEVAGLIGKPGGEHEASGHGGEGEPRFPRGEIADRRRRRHEFR